MDDNNKELVETVLIVDDDPGTVQYLAQLTKEAGYSVLAVRSAEKVLPILRAKRPDIVLLDATIPDIDGYELCARILAEPGLGHTPVMFITGKQAVEDVVKGFEAGAVDYIIKPVRKVELLARMRNHLDRRHYERLLSRERERFRLLTNNVAEVYILFDASFSMIRYVNPAFERIFGASLGRLPANAKRFFELFDPAEAEAIVEKMELAITSDRSFSRESKLRRPDGTLRWVWSRAYAIEGEEEHGFVCVIEDITDRKVAEQQLLEALEKEARTAGAIQQSLLMNEAELTAPGVESILFSRPSRNIDGDFFDVYPFEGVYSSNFDVVVGDVMGKGIHAALIGAGAKSRFLRAHASVGGRCGVDQLPEISEIVESVDRAMAKQLIGLDSFFTVQYMRFMQSRGYLEYVDCGHMPIVIWDGEACWAYKGMNPPIGFMENQIFTSCRVPLRPGNTVLVYSDGVTECAAPDGELFGETRLLDSIRRNVELGPAALAGQLQIELEAYSKGMAFHDDVTLAVFRIGSEGAPPPARLDLSIDFPADLDTLKDIRAAVARLLEAYSITEIGERERDLAVLAASEAASNVIIHGLGNDRSLSLTVRLEARDDWYSIIFRYQGRDFDWTRDRKPSVLALDESGYGLFIIKSTMRSFVVTHSDAGSIDMILAGDVRRGA